MWIGYCYVRVQLHNTKNERQGVIIPLSREILSPNPNFISLLEVETMLYIRHTFEYAYVDNARAQRFTVKKYLRVYKNIHVFTM